MDKTYYDDYGELINPWYINHLKKIGIFNTGVKAEGVVITDLEGNEFIDCTSGYGIGNLGYNNPKVVNALIEQLKRSDVNTRPFINKIQIELAELLKEISPGSLECSYLLNSGSEAIETALKLVRLYKGQKKIITMEHSFHGHTLGALSASGVPAFKKSFMPLLPAFEQVPFGDFDLLEKSVDDNTAAVLIEPIQHDAGVKIPSKKYIKSVRELCTEKNIILIFDEVITGIGKTGYMFASEYFEVEPDILVTGKSLGAGLIPIGAVLAKRNLWQRFGMSFPMTASSYGGNALACCAAIESIKFIRESDILKSVKGKSELLYSGLKNLASKYSKAISSISGIGMLFGLRMEDKNVAASVVRKMIDNKVIVYQSFGNPFVIMVEPPLVISEVQIKKVIATFNYVLEEII